MSIRTRRALTAAPFVVIGLMFLACGGTTKADQPGPAPAVSDPNAATTAAPAGPGLNVNEPAPIGTAVQPAKDWTVNVAGVNLQGDTEMVKLNQFNKPEAGNRFVLVNIGIRNNSDKPASVASNLKLSVLVAGVAHDPMFGMAPAPKLDLSAQLQPNATVQGWVPFEVPADAQGPVLLAEPLFTVDKGTDQRFLALS